MDDHDTDLASRTAPWLRTRFDIEGWIGAAAALVIGLLLGWLWAPLFWIGAVAAILALLATRHTKRFPPADAHAIVSPVDGIVTEIVEVPTPAPLELASETCRRVRISTSPLAANRVYAPQAGTALQAAREPGEQSVVLASRPDKTGLERALVVIDGAGRRVGLVVATGAFGPRLDLDAKPDQVCELGDVIAKRRLGGWCDVFVSEDTDILVRPGQTLIGGETRLVGSAGMQTPATGTQAGTVQEPRGEPDDTATPDDQTAALFERLRQEVADPRQED